MKWLAMDMLWLTKWQLHQARNLVQWGLVWCNSVEAELRDMERE